MEDPTRGMTTLDGGPTQRERVADPRARRTLSELGVGGSRGGAVGYCVCDCCQKWVLGSATRGGFLC